MPRMSQPGADRAAEPLSRQMAPAAPRRLPPDEPAINAEIAHGIDPERCRDAEGCRQRAAERGPDRAAEVEADAVRRDRSMQVPLRHELRRNRLPCGRRQRSEGADQKREYEE